jgi:hypothetical protein
VLLASADLNDLCDVAVENIVPPLEEYLRTIAYNSGWPANFIANLNISVDEDYTLSISYPDDMEDEIGDLEYGNLNALPNAVIRPFLLRAPDVINQILQDVILPQLLADLGVL